MAKTNLQIVAEKVYANRELWKFLEQIVDYYMSLRCRKYEDLAYALGYANKSSMSMRLPIRFTPLQVEKIIEFLNIEDLDANRIRAKYWAAFCETTPDNCQFNRLFSPDVESIIRGLTFDNRSLRHENEALRLHASIVAEICADVSAKKNKKTP